ncbi:MAG: hypothetical protein LBU53_08335, partial [Zoogloeaceae bacterium]|nr:hypothetical protein [Zoogloeaceae bacterium]
MQFRHFFGGFDVEFYLVVVGFSGFVSGEDGEFFNMSGKIFQLDDGFFARDATVQNDVVKVADHDEFGDFVGGEVNHVVFCLFVGVLKVFASGLHFDGDFLFPEAVDVTIAPVVDLDPVLEFVGVVEHARCAEHVEETKQKFLRVRFFAPLGGFPLARENLGALLNFNPRQCHAATSGDFFGM